MSRQLPEIHSGQWAEMGNQQGKGGKRAAPGQTYPFDEPEKKSRTDWTAGNTPDDSLDQFSLLPTTLSLSVVDESQKSQFEKRKRNLKAISPISRGEREI